jgi:hypothetical protein
MFSEVHTVTISKLSKRSLREGIAEVDQEKLRESVTSRTLEVAGWRYVFGAVERTEAEVDGFNWEYSYSVQVSYLNPNVLPEPQTFPMIVRQFSGKASQPQQNRWTLSAVDGETYAPDAITSDSDDENLGYAPVEIPEDIDTYFSHLFGLGAQIRMVKRALRTAIESGWTKRENTVLYGPPGCGKSDVALSLKAALGGDAVWSLDASQLTDAGIIKALSEMDILPRVVVLEEAEKANQESIRSFLAMLDTRGEIRKVTARGAIQRETKVLAFCTVNDTDKFGKMLDGALASRFNNPVKFNRPDRTILTSILEREVKSVNGNMEWIAPALDFCDKHNLSDPRRVISVCLLGQDDLLTGEYQADAEATMDTK